MSTPPIDEESLEPSVFSRLTGAMPVESALAMAAEVTRIFAEDSRTRLASAREALGVYDLPKVGQAAHNLRTSAAMIGARRLATLATRLETLAGSGERRGANDLLVALDQECGRIAIALARLSKSETRQVA